MGPASLVLSDGSVFHGQSFGAPVEVTGEAVFTTGMVGYPESLTDPSYRGQLLVLTYPLVGNYGMFSDKEVDANGLPVHLESERIQVSALIVGSYSTNHSHWRAVESLAAWLQRSGVPAICGVDTRALTKKLRSNGVMLGAIVNGHEPVGTARASSIEDPNVRNLVAEVSTPAPRLFRATNNIREGEPAPRICAVDVGIKYNQIRCFTERGCDVEVVPWDHNLSQVTCDGIFLSNGPGDPTRCDKTIANLRTVLAAAKKPIFGICLGHQLLSLAAGAKTRKMLYGNRGQNIPCIDQESGRCYITSQNHGFAVDAASLPDGWKELFVNANDGSNEGVKHTTLPYFSVQFHPESFCGPRDTEFLFDRFIDAVRAARALPPTATLQPLPVIPHITRHERVRVRKVLILGSGGLSIGQAGEFDYSGSQAIKALKEEGIYTVLINPNIATIQTSKGLADKVYFLPVNAEFVRKVIQYERPDGIYVSFGGQTALNVGVQLKDEFEGLGVRVLGTPIDTVILTEDREMFARAMESIGERCAASASATTVEEGMAAGRSIGFPVIVRAAFALGGLGSGFANNEEELLDLCHKAFAVSPQVLIERSMKGWKEIEYEVVRDINDNCITVCNMENFDPLGIHTGDSIVVAPSQTLSDRDYHRLRTTAINVIRHLGVVGECNIQYAVNPDSDEYCIIEVNARLSRSSALASKATGYPLAFVAAKLGLHIPLTEIKNSVTRSTCACFEPSLDYCVVKVPRWDLRKFTRVSTRIASAMKSVGEVMAIGRTFEEAIQKAIRAVDPSFQGFEKNNICTASDEALSVPTDARLFAVANAMHSGYTNERIWELTKIDHWFLDKLRNIVNMDNTISGLSVNLADFPTDLLRRAKQLGFGDPQISRCIKSTALAVRQLRLERGVVPVVKQIDTVAAEFPAHTNYLYLTYNGTENDVEFRDQGVIVLGSGVYRIGSSVEFDWCAVRCIRTLRANGFKTVMINYNPETVSTDYDEADRLYFENIIPETVLDIYTLEQSSGVVVSMGGQTPNNIAQLLDRQHVNILGTTADMIDTAENRYKFSRMLDKIGVDQPEWREITSMDDSRAFCRKVGYPVLVRPSYVLSGAAMTVVFTEADLEGYLNKATAVSPEHPVVISKFIENAKEIEVDAIARQGEVVMHIVAEHVENAGVHSGDATLVLPPQDLDAETVAKIEIATRKIGNALNVTGPYNIQFIAKDGQIKVIECNLRASRSMPFASKVLDVDLIEMATRVMMGLPVTPYPPTNVDYVAVKVPQFSFSRLSGADPVLGVEMASTGEVACFGKDKYEAYLKALLSTAFVLPKKNILLSIGSYKEKVEMFASVERLHQMGYKLFGTAGTADYYREQGLPITTLELMGENSGEGLREEYSLTHALANKHIDLYINLPSNNSYRRPANYMSAGYVSRRMAVDFSIPLITNVKCAKLFVESIARKDDLPIHMYDYKTSSATALLPGLIDLNMHLAEATESAIAKVTSDALAGGFTAVGLSGISAKDIAAVRAAVRAGAVCDVALLPESDGASVDALSMAVAYPAANVASMAKLTAAFAAWPTTGAPLVSAVEGAELAAMIFLASAAQRAIHFTGVKRAVDLVVIRAAKERGHKVTCDVSIGALFFAQDSSDAAAEEVEAMWSSLDVIDCFTASSETVATALSLLMTAVAAGRLTINDIIERLHVAPTRIFGLPVQTDTFAIVEVDRDVSAVPNNVVPSVIGGRSKLCGYVSRVVVRGVSTILDAKHVSVSRESVAPVEIRRVAATVPHDAAVPAANLATSSPMLPPAAAVESPARRPAVAPATALQAAAPSTAVVASSVAPAVATSPFLLRSVLNVGQWSRNDLHAVFGVAHELKTRLERKSGVLDSLRGRVLCNLFYEPSTRTSASFETAMKRLGGEVLSVNAISSSVAKGESLADTVRTLENYADVIVMRHPAPGSVAEAAKVSRIPIINAGDGIGEHPTQAMLDVYTIREELGTVNGLDITIAGDLTNGRTVHSLVRLLAHYNVRIHYVPASPALGMPEEIVRELAAANISQTVHSSLEDVIGFTDVLYMTRIQKERFESEAEYDRARFAAKLVVTPDLMIRAKEKMIVMHPLPRVDEIDKAVDLDARAAYFRQMRYGLYVRMALLLLVFGKE